MSIFNKDFYPTPINVIDRMMLGIDITNKVILEPSAGSGAIVDYLYQHGAKDVIACETSTELQKVLNGKCRILADDFLTVKSEQISHIDMIVMNPPFSADEKHILHAFEIAPDGCEIISLCNYETINSRYCTTRKQLYELIELHGRYENFGNCFLNSDRRTDVEIGYIRLIKPKIGADEFKGYFSMDEQIEEQEHGIMSYNYVRDIVNRYVGAVKMFDSVINASNAINELTKDLHTGIEFGVTVQTERYGVRSHQNITREVYKKELQKAAWMNIFNKMDMEKYVTKGVREKINKFVEQQVNVPFTMQNIYKMIELIVMTNSNRMNDTLVESFEKICSYSAENSTAGEKWKTNSDYKLNKRFIIPYICQGEKWGTKNVFLTLQNYHNDIDDVNKALCYITGTPYEKIEWVKELYSQELKKVKVKTILDLNDFIDKNNLEWGKWHDWGFFRIRGYKKGTMHFEFIDDKVLDLFNYKVAELKGWELPKARTKKI